MLLKVTKKQFKTWSKREPSKATKAHKIRKSKTKAIETYLDMVWSGKVKEAAGWKCERCGATNGLASHHVFSRAIKSVRHYIPNGVCLCNGHHFNFHIYPAKYTAWIQSERGMFWYDDLNTKAQTRGKERFK